MSDYKEPTKVYKTANEIIHSTSPEIFFNHPKCQKMQENWCAGFFGLGFSAYVCDCKIKMNNSEKNSFPDFYLRVNGKEFEFEVTERQCEGRKRGQYYKQLKNNPNQTTPYRPLMETEKGPRWIYEAIGKKAGKRYGKNVNLLIYANFYAKDINWDELRSMISEFQGVFDSIWIITNTHICSLFSTEELGSIDGFGEVPV